MPQFDPEGRPAVVLEWLAAEGDPIEVGQEVVRVEGDKTVLALESFVAGRLLQILVPAGCWSDAPILGLSGPGLRPVVCWTRPPPAAGPPRTALERDRRCSVAGSPPPC